MKIKDYGERVKLEICNLLYQKEEEYEFDSFNKAWIFAKDFVDTKLLKFFVYRDTNPKKPYLLRMMPKKSGYLLMCDWDTTRTVDTVDEVFQAFSTMVLELEEPSW